MNGKRGELLSIFSWGLSLQDHFKQTPPLSDGAPPFPQGLVLRTLYSEGLGGALRFS